MKKATINIRGMKFYAYHGCFEKEKIVGTPFQVNARMEYDATLPTQSDNIEDALNYQKAYNLIAEEMKVTANILEYVVERILDRLFLEFPQLLYAEVEVQKLAPPMNGEIESVGVTLQRSK